MCIYKGVYGDLYVLLSFEDINDGPFTYAFLRTPVQLLTPNLLLRIKSQSKRQFSSMEFDRAAINSVQCNSCVTFLTVTIVLRAR